VSSDPFLRCKPGVPSRRLGTAHALKSRDEIVDDVSEVMVMRMRNTLVLLVATAFLGVVPGNAADSALRIEVTPRISNAPAQVRIRAIVTPSAENRGLRIVADSGDFYRSSYVPLDGDHAALVTETSFKNLPGGDYEISVAVLDAQGHTTNVDRRTVMVTSSGLR
jgi:hypothetical protein